MPYTREEVVSEAEEFLLRRSIRVVVQEMPIEERLQGITPEQRLRGLTPEDREILLRLLEEPASTRPACEPPIFVPAVSSSPQTGNQPRPPAV